ncbi:MAG: glycosyltransferase [Candidatus Marinimicrobia bacterium]|nr:glycosyltransferase [Candidatus Neomarinimicrobiota bacterium]
MESRSKIRVLLVTPNFYPFTTGPAIDYKVLAEGIEKESDISLIVLTGYMRGEKLIEKHINYKIYRMLLVKRIPLKRSPQQILAKIFFFLTYHLSLMILILLFSLSFKVHVIHILAGAVTVLSGKFHNIVLEVLLKCLPCTVILDVRGSAWIPKSDWCYDRILHISQAIHKQLINNGIGPGKCIYMPSPVEVSAIKEPYETVKRYVPYICFVGMVKPAKGIYELLEGFSRLSRVFSKYHLLIVGPNREGDSFMKVLNQYRKVVYFGMLSHDVVLGIIKYAELLVLPSKVEGMPRVCLEAMALGKKVLCPPGIFEFEIYCPEFVVPDITPDAIKNKIEEILSGPSVPDFPPLKQMTSEKYIETMIRVYQSLVEDERK